MKTSAKAEATKTSPATRRGPRGMWVLGGMAGALPVLLAAAAGPLQSAGEMTEAQAVPSLRAQALDSDGAGGPFLPRSIGRSAEHVKPNLTLAAYHRSYPMVQAGPLQYPEGGLEFYLRELEAAGLLSAETSTALGMTYSIPTATKPARQTTSSFVASVELPDMSTLVPRTGPATDEAPEVMVNVLFSAEESFIDEIGADTLEEVANRVLKTGTTLQIYAYAGGLNDRSSAARRLALRRGLAVRTYLNEQGVPKTRMSVHPVGGVGDAGPPDRVDVILPTG